MPDILEPILLPGNFNYIAAFLTFSCMLKCGYCINHHGRDLVRRRTMSADDWVRGLNRLVPRADLPITLQGGEPTLHKNFYDIVSGINAQHPLDLLTNLEIDPDEFMRRIAPDRIKRTSPYASIRVSYHKDQQDAPVLFKKVRYLLDRGYSLGVWVVDHPQFRDHTMTIKKMAEDMGIDFRLKEFLGSYQGENFGTMRYPEAVNAPQLRHSDCRTTEFLIDPAGFIFRCHSDLYANRFPIGHILEKDSPKLLGQWVPCSVFGKCNPCDIKVKFNRFQEHGHSSVEICNISGPYAPNKELVSS